MPTGRGAGRMSRGDSFSRQLLAWWDEHGRHDLPWQRDRDPYRIWLAEVMLQQTQVATVIPFFDAFLARFGDVRALAAAAEDDVLHLWSGLGYYARGRNLRRAARLILERHEGQCPRDLEALQALPGIGRSTAGAILAQAWGDRHPILDGNVKRVLARYHAVDGWPGRAAVLRRLWAHADAHTPEARVADYTQAIMDLGATLCRGRRPNCGDCPVAAGCAARALGRQADFPGRKPRRERPLRHTVMLLVEDRERRILLQRRPSEGLWGGLWSLPETESVGSVTDWCLARLGSPPARMQTLPAVRHGFTHFELEVRPVLVEMPQSGLVMEGDGWLWYNGDPAERLGLAAVVSRLLRSRDPQVMGEIE